MSIEQLDKIDIIGTSPQGEIILIISDHYEWDPKGQHILLLQDKLNAYIHFIESGQVLEEYPQTKDNPPAIEVVFKYEPTSEWLPCLVKFEEVIAGLGFKFSWRTHKPL